MQLNIYISTQSKHLLKKENKYVFQSKAMFDFYLSLKNYSPFFVCIKDKEKVLAHWLGVIIQEKKVFPSFLASRCLFIGEPIFSTQVSSEEKLIFFEKMIQHVDKYLLFKCLFLEIRHFSNNNPLNLVLEQKKDFFKTPWYNIINQLDKNTIKASKIRQVKSALKKGVSIKKAESLSEIKDFYFILKKTYKNIKKPLPPFLFFKNFFYSFCLKNKGICLLSIKNNKVIGGILCVFSGKEIVHEWYVASLHQKYKYLYPGVFTTYSALKFSQEEDFSFFDFMGAGAQNIAYGVRDFKLSFGGDLQDEYRWKKVYFPFLYRFILWVNKYL